MDEIKPVAWLCVWNGEEGECTWAQYHGKFDPLPEEWDETPDEIEPYYDQQDIDTLRAEVEDSEGAARVWRRRCQEAEARAERAEAEAEALRKLIWRVVAEANWRTSSHDLWFELVKATRETAIDAAKQAAE